MPYYELVTNTDCNLRCKYCYMCNATPRVNTIENCINYLRASYKRDYSSEVSDEELMSRLCDRGCHKNCDLGDSARFERSRNQRPHFCILGGEEFLHLDLMDAILTEYCNLNNQYNLGEPRRVVVTTNGTLFNREDVQEFLRKWKDLLFISFSIDGLKEVHNSNRVYIDGTGTYDDVINGVNIAKEILTFDNIGVVATFTPETKQYYSQSVIELLKMGFISIAPRFIDGMAWPDETTEEVYQMFLPIIDWIIENRKWNVVRSDGEIHPLHLTPLIRGKTYYGPMTESILCIAGRYPTLGADGLLYLCHRDGAKDGSHPYGHLDGENFVFDDIEFYNKLPDMWKQRPRKCLNCEAGCHCWTCLSTIFEKGLSVKEYFEQYPLCGWVKGTLKARKEYTKRLAQID